MMLAAERISEGISPSQAARELLVKIARRSLSIELEPSDIVKDARGKPYDKKGRFFFSLSHSGDTVAVLTADAPCGVDVQTITHVSDGALKKLGIVPPFPETDRERTALWALAESYVKMTGEGIAGLSKVPVLSVENGKVTSDPDCIFEIKETDSYVLATCIRANKNEL